MNDYKVKFVVCGNTETVGNCGEFCEEAADEWTREACRQLESLPFVADVDEDSTFRNWHGGKYAEQSAMHGFGRFGNIVATRTTREVEVEVDEDDEPETTTEVGRWDELPASARDEYEAAIWKCAEAADEARDAVQTKIDAIEAKYAEEDSQ